MSYVTIFCRHWLNAHCATITVLLTLGTIAGTSRATTVDFEDLSLAPNSYWNGPNSSGGFTSRGVFFNNSNPYGWWSGWSYSNVNDTTTVGPGNQYAAYTGTGVGGSGNYAMGYVGDPDYAVLPTITIPDGMEVQTAMFTNTTYAAQSMLQGDEYARKFGCTWNDTTQSWDDTSTSDWFKLTVYGTDTTGTLLPNTVEFYLADYRNLGGTPDYITNTWQSVDLSSLSAARTLQFSLTSSDNSTYAGISYMNTPAYFAMDNMTLAPIPEPSSLVLLCAAGIAGAVWRYRRRRSPQMATLSTKEWS